MVRGKWSVKNSIPSLLHRPPTTDHHRVLSVWAWMAVGVVAAWLASTSAEPAGFRIYDQGASAAGQADAFTAQADDASAVCYNPAGMTQVRGIQLMAGATLIGGSTRFRNGAGAAARGDFGDSVAYPPPSNFYVTANLRDAGLTALDGWSAGLAVLSPFGTLYQYPASGPFATAVTGAALELIDVKPTLAYKVNESLSFGIGLDVYSFYNFWGEGQYETRLISSGGAGLPPAGTPIEINGKGTATGFNVSLMATPVRTNDGKPKLNLGLVYRSQAALHLNGEFLANGTTVSRASTTLVLPQILTGGVAWWPFRDREREWKLEWDVDWTGWQSIRNTDVSLSTGSTIPFPQQWRHSLTTMVGTEYKWLGLSALPRWDLALRAGYWFSESPVPDRAYNPVVPDSNNHALSVGLGLTCHRGGMLFGLVGCGSASDRWGTPKGLGLDLAYKALFYETRTVSGSANPVAVPGAIDGTYRTTFHIGSVNVRMDF